MIIHSLVLRSKTNRTGELNRDFIRINTPEFVKSLTEAIIFVVLQRFIIDLSSLSWQVDWNGFMGIR